MVEIGEPYRLGQIGLVGNNFRQYQLVLKIRRKPYRLGQIGLVGNLKQSSLGTLTSRPYRLGQIGLVGNFLGNFFLGEKL